ncbi:hypothetical protein A1O3_00567 [Capronia epimyces CBS 606.96]|uniref:ChrR-like cupin domain-containing protein n=1 Tax=Capronia epimyces CBS 606.96 TaxID=1182542 RepID=W9YGJ7_9EURO|nr:uncharacterized protein A1O3_00567 [Capronia epimyces CBS 606.96]EXJ92017.1 hypothetical protein A1O3_00567 [Capronia epimyces CBS 606.96]
MTGEESSGPAMTYFAEEDIPWEEQTAMSRRKVLRLEEDLYVAMVQWDAGFTLPVTDHHGGEEIVYVLKGTFVDQYRSSGPGSIIRGDPGSSHRPSTPDGVTFLVTRSLIPGERQRIAPHWTRPRGTSFRG